MRLYDSDTLVYIDTVTQFCDRHCKWRLDRQTELCMLRDIREQRDKLNLNIADVYNS